MHRNCSGFLWRPNALRTARGEKCPDAVSPHLAGSKRPHYRDRCSLLAVFHLVFASLKGSYTEVFLGCMTRTEQKRGLGFTHWLLYSVCCFYKRKIMKSFPNSFDL